MKPFTFFCSCLCLNLLSLASIAANSDSLKTENKKKPVYRASNTITNDILHTRLDVKFDWNKSEMDGKASITVKPFFKPTSTLNLDARGMEIKSLEVYDLNKTSKPGLVNSDPEFINSPKLPSSFVYQNDSIKINLGREFKADEKYLVKINYTAKPNDLKKGGSEAISEDKGLYFINPKGEDKNKMPQIWTQGETQSSSAWFPTIDSPNEKMTNEIYMTVDSKYTTLSNGTLSDSKKNADGTRTDHWKMELPHSPYLLMMAVGEFKKVTDTPWNGKEISYYVEKEYEPYAKAIFGNTGEMIEFFSKTLGTPYPWAKYSQIVVRDYVSGAMENTSATLHGDFMVYQTDREMLDGKKGEDVISHELFHQWFGDLATAESWSNLPLNESFATYGEYLWQEYKNGRDAADAHHFNSRNEYFMASEEKQVEVVRYNYNNREDMFDAFSYNKGGQILHMLRKYVGDQAFFASLKLYLEKRKFKSAEIHDLRLAFEETTGEDLNWFFNQWFLTSGHPKVEVSKDYDAANKILTLHVKQTQDLKEAPLYKMPVDIDLYYDGKKERKRITITDKEQDFKIACPLMPNLVTFDAERQLLAIKNFPKSTDESLFMIKHAPLFGDRFEAVHNLQSASDREDVYLALAETAQKDAWWEVRSAALRGLKNWLPLKEAEIKKLVKTIAESDKNTKVRGEALMFLSENIKDPGLDEFYIQYLNEQSYEVISSAIAALGKSNPQLAMQKVKPFENETNEKIFSAVANLYAKQGNDDNLPYFVNARNKFEGNQIYLYIYMYGQFLKHSNNAQTFETAAGNFEDVYKIAVGFQKDFIKRTYTEELIGSMAKKIEELKKNNADAAKISELETMQKSLEARLAKL